MKPYGVLYTKKKTMIVDASKDNLELRKNLMQYIELDTACLRKVCAFTADDWKFYQECCAYEFLDNRDEEDKKDIPRYGNLEESSFMLSEKLFTELKDEFEEKTNLYYKLYQYLRFCET
jgi:hypothetical protein